MLNIGPQELILILVVALVIVGPKKLPELARAIGRGMNEFRKLQDEVKDLVQFDLSADPDEEPTSRGTANVPVPSTGVPVADDLPDFTADLAEGSTAEGSPTPGSASGPEPEPLPTVRAGEREPGSEASLPPTGAD